MAIIPVYQARLQRWLPFLAWPRPSRTTLAGELWAGITVGLMVVPQGVASAALAGMPLVTGIYVLRWRVRFFLTRCRGSSDLRYGSAPTYILIGGCSQSISTDREKAKRK